MEAIPKKASSASTIALAPQPFRFLDLPAEIRIIVYEHLPVTTVTHICRIKYEVRNDCNYLVCSTTKLQFALLASSKLVRAEAQPYLDKALAKTQLNLFHCTNPNDNYSRAQVAWFIDLITTAGSSKYGYVYTPDLLVRAEFLTRDDADKVQDFCKFAKHHRKATGRMLKVEINWHSGEHLLKDRHLRRFIRENGVTVCVRRELPAALKLHLAEVTGV